MKYTLVIVVTWYYFSILSEARASFQHTPFIATSSITRNIKATFILLHNHPGSNSNGNSIPSTSASTSTTKTSHIIFPGGGIFFYWQAGAVSYLREKGYDLDSVTLTGASAGSLTATLTAANVDFEKATNIALRLAEDAGVWERPLGLQGVWGGLIETWLDELLPEDVMDMVGDRLSLLVTPVPSFGKEKISTFKGRKDLIKTNMASVHIPWFLDSKLTATYRGDPYIDGSFLSKPIDYDKSLPSSWSTDSSSSSIQTSAVVILDWTQDPVLANKSLGDAVSAISKDGIWTILEQGKKYAAIMEERGDFRGLPMQS
mmetsp:Transcript_20130/g.24055  ORF Transcript_20130/g.24055 Transcript_20130/m.24055 type:complete len:316 (+) Transcript_20130:65-1012(+)|eukprot:CAMPEP_0198272512 /NCGR_PEP_ID=MMETSP1447-20131203/53441_1 /TAXON_ID=420782 /ORGANISM="Chaetoceros dichaeta, Strain CCMP1751" /LENGTH=315 /DNA_ID=CAMNT_0043965719 /DNA_START=44 /DNA_END=991 /DNA_ORIENTATION=+